MRTSILTTLILAISICYYGQNISDHNQKSKEILARVSENYQKYTTIKFMFTLGINSQDINENQEGFALIKGQQFYYETAERKVICNGNTVWTLILDDDECYIDNLADLDNTINPSEIFTVWETGFNYKYVKKENNSHFIKMYPENPDKSNYHTIIMKVNDSTNTIEQSTIKTKDGVSIKLTITNLIGNPSLNSDVFNWIESDNPSIDVIDNR